MTCTRFRSYGFFDPNGHKPYYRPQTPPSGLGSITFDTGTGIGVTATPRGITPNAEIFDYYKDYGRNLPDFVALARIAVCGTHVFASSERGILELLKNDAPENASHSPFLVMWVGPWLLDVRSTYVPLVDILNLMVNTSYDPSEPLQPFRDRDSVFRAAVTGGVK